MVAPRNSLRCAGSPGFTPTLYSWAGGSFMGEGVWRVGLYGPLQQGGLRSGQPVSPGGTGLQPQLRDRPHPNLSPPPCSHQMTAESTCPAGLDVAGSPEGKPLEKPPREQRCGAMDKGGIPRHGDRRLPLLVWPAGALFPVSDALLEGEMLPNEMRGCTSLESSRSLLSSLGFPNCHQSQWGPRPDGIQRQTPWGAGMVEGSQQGSKRGTVS